MGNRYVKLDDKKEILYIDDNNLHGWAMSEKLPYDENKFDRNLKIKDTLTTPEDVYKYSFCFIDIWSKIIRISCLPFRTKWKNCCSFFRLSWIFPIIFWEKTSINFQ